MLESLSSEEMQFIKAIENYKQENGKLFLSWTEVLKILKELGYKKVARKESDAEPAPAKKSKAKTAAKAEAAEATEKVTAGEAESGEGQ